MAGSKRDYYEVLGVAREASVEDTQSRSPLLKLKGASRMLSRMLIV